MSYQKHDNDLGLYGLFAWRSPLPRQIKWCYMFSKWQWIGACYSLSWVQVWTLSTISHCSGHVMLKPVLLENLCQCHRKMKMAEHWSATSFNQTPNVQHTKALLSQFTLKHWFLHDTTQTAECALFQCFSWQVDPPSHVSKTLTNWCRITFWKKQLTIIYCGNHCLYMGTAVSCYV